MGCMMIYLYARVLFCFDQRCKTKDNIYSKIIVTSTAFYHHIRLLSCREQIIPHLSQEELLKCIREIIFLIITHCGSTLLARILIEVQLDKHKSSWSFFLLCRSKERHFFC